MKNKQIVSAFSLLLLVFCEILFFRNVLFNSSLFGDRGDGRLTMLITEHWWKFFSGKEKFSDLLMFYPAKNVVGYTDMLFGFGIIHSLFRFVGLDMFLSYKITMILIHLIGTVSMYILLNTILKCKVVWSLFGTIAFCYSDTFARFFIHTQLNAISFLPSILIILIIFVRNYYDDKKRSILAFAFLSLFAILTYTSWYVACFTGLYGLIFAVLFLYIKRKEGNLIVPLLKDTVCAKWKYILLYFAFFLVLFLPFIYTYLPIFLNSSGYSYGVCTQYMPEAIDIINVSEGNLMLGWLIKKMRLTSRAYSFEVEEGFSIILLLSFIILSIRSLIGNKKGCYFEADEKCVINASIISIIISIFLVVRLSSNGVSLWFLVVKLLPFTKSLRAVARFFLWLSFPISVVTAYLGNKYLGNDNKPIVFISIVSLLLLIFSNINTVGVNSNWNRNNEIEFVDSIPHPPKGIDSFFIYDTGKEYDFPWIYQVDAFEIATIYSLNTINGYSGQNPPNWNSMWDVNAPEYFIGVDNWIHENNLVNVFGYDRSKKEWNLYK